MRNWLTIRTHVLVFAFALITFGSVIITIRAQTSPPTPPGFVFYSMRAGTNAPPLPENPNFLPQYPLGGGSWLVDDRRSARSILGSSSSTSGSGGGVIAFDETGPPDPGSGSTNGTPLVVTNTLPLDKYPPGSLWLDVLPVTNSQIYVRVNGALSNYVQLEFRTNIMDTNWYAGPYLEFTSVVTNFDFGPIQVTNPPTMFFRVHISDTLVNITPGVDAKRYLPTNTPSVSGSFTIAAQPITNDDHLIHISYVLGGDAQEGIDYSNLVPHTVAFGVNDGPGHINIGPIRTNGIVFNEDIVATLTCGGGYVVRTDSGYSTATITLDQLWTNSFLQLVSSNFNAPPVGMAYHSPSNLLIISVGGLGAGQSNTFKRITSTGTIYTNWGPGIVMSTDEVNPAIVQATAGGFINGDMFFPNGLAGGIGWLSANSSNQNFTWITLPGESVIGGSVYVDQTGIFNHDLIAAIGDDPDALGGNLWRIDSHTNTTLFANLGANNPLEGLITLTNSSQYGPWAGNILVGSESFKSIYAIDTNGTVVPYQLGILPEDFNIIRTNQNFYVTVPNFPAILKLPGSCLTNFPNDVLVTQEGLGVGGFSIPEKLVIVHWDASRNQFVKHTIPSPMPPPGIGDFEQGIFAPMDIPASPLPNP